MRVQMGFSGVQGQGRSINANSGESLNCYLEPTSAGETILTRRAGQKLAFTLPNSPVRGCFSDSEISYWVAGNGVYKRTPDNIVKLLGNIATVNGLVNFASSGVHLLLVDGVNGWDITLATDAFAQIVDASFPPNPVNINHLNSFFVATFENSQRFYVKIDTSATWNALDFATAEGNPDNILSQKVLNGELVLIGYETLEVWGFTGNADFPFQRNQGVVIDHGCIAPNSPGKANDALYWLGGDSIGSGIVWTLSGYQAQRVSTHEIEQKIKQILLIEDAFSITYQIDGHIFYILQFPSAGKSLGYDTTTGLWHTLGFRDGTTGLENIWRASCHCFSGSMNLVGDTQSGKVFQLGMDIYEDDGNDIVMERVSTVSKNAQDYLFYQEMIIDLETGVGNNASPGEDPKIGLCWSDDGGHTWGNWRFTTMGKIGQYRARAYWEMLGSARNRVWKIRVTDRVKCILLAGVANIKQGLS